MSVKYFKAIGEDFEDVFAYPEQLDTHSVIKHAPETLKSLEIAISILGIVLDEFGPAPERVQDEFIGLVEVLRKAKGDFNNETH